MFSKFSAYPDELVIYFTNKNIKLPGIDSLRGQALALMSQPNFVNGQIFIDRKIAENFFKNIGLETADAIQPFNKPNNMKLVKSKKGLYSLIYPFDMDFFQIEKRTKVHRNVLENGTKTEQVKNVKNYWKKKVKIKMDEIETLLSIGEYKLYSFISDKLTEVRWIMKYILEPHENEWQIGHLDAGLGNSPNNLRFQPPIQAQFRDKYIFNTVFERLKK